MIYRIHLTIMLALASGIATTPCTMNAHNVPENEPDICTFCQDELRPEEMRAKLLDCKHDCFHAVCPSGSKGIKEWWQKGGTCPICRAEIKECTTVGPKKAEATTTPKQTTADTTQPGYAETSDPALLEALRRSGETAKADEAKREEIRKQEQKDIETAAANSVQTNNEEETWRALSEFLAWLCRR